MKKLVLKTTAILVLMAFCLLLCNGRSKYNEACFMASYGEGSDIAITQTLYQYGFDLDVFETPTITDYLMSNFK